MSIADAMVWCADHASCAKEITQCLYESLTIDETPLHKKVFVGKDFPHWIVEIKSKN